MESQTHFSKHLHELFLSRFKGRIATIGREGQVVEVSNCCRPIDKLPPHTHIDVLHAQVPTQKSGEEFPPTSSPVTKLSTGRNYPLPRHHRTESLVLRSLPLAGRVGLMVVTTKSRPADGQTGLFPTTGRYNDTGRHEAVIRRQSLPRTYRATQARETGQIESLARTNFRQIGYMSLSNGRPGMVCAIILHTSIPTNTTLY